MKRRIWGILIISLLLLLGFGTATMSFAANNQGTPGLQYEVIDDNYPYCILTGVGSATEKNIVIPEDWNNLHVRGIAAGAFKDCTFIESVSLPTFVTGIGREAFKGCTNLNNINLHNVLHVEDSCFEGCSSLDNVYLGNVMTIGNYAFSKTGISGKIYLDYCTSLGMGAFDNCWDLEKVSLRSGTQTINDYTFYECRSLKEINLSSSLQSVGNGAFYNCTSLNTDIFNTENNVSSIGDYAFWNCTALDGPLILNNINSIGKYAFCNCSSLDGSLILNNISSIGEYTFCNCSSLDGSLILNNIHSVGEYAFSNCTGLKEVKLAKTLTSSSATAFENLSSVEYLEIGKCIESFNNESFSQFSALKTLEVIDSIDTLKDILVGNKTLETVRIAEINGIKDPGYGYTDIDLSDCTNLRVFKLSSGGSLNLMFAGCSSLEELSVEGGNLWFDDNTLRDCNNLKKLILSGVHPSPNTFFHGLPNLEEYVGPRVFFTRYICPRLTRATMYGFPNSSYDASDIFENSCPNLEELIVKDGAQRIGKEIFDKAKKLHSLIIEGTNEVDFTAFQGNSSLKYISLPDVTTIKVYGLSHCASLETVIIPSVKVFEVYSVDNCDNLKTVVIGDAIPDIREYAFDSSKAVSIYSSLTREEFVQKAGEGYFQDWMPPFYFLGEYDIVDGEYIKREKYPIKWFDHKGNLIKTTTVFEGEMPKEIGAPVLSGYVFERWTPNLKKVESAQEYRAVMVPDLSYEFSGGECTVKGIGNYTDKELVIPDTYKGCKVTKIAPEAFEGCSSLKSVFIGKNVSSIDELAFKDCYALETLAVDADNAYYCTEGNVLYDKAKATLILAADKGVKGTFIIPDTVTSVGEQAIRHCTEITEVIIPDSIKEFKPGSFMNCTSLMKVVFPDTVTKLGSAAFMNCESLEYVDFGKGLKTLPAACCSKCPNLTTAVIGDKISTLYLVPFLECPSLKDIYFTGDEGAWDKLLHTVSPLDTVIKNATVHFGHPDDMQFDGYGSDYSDATKDSQRSSSSTVTVPVTGDENTVKVSATVSGSTATVKKIKAEDLEKVTEGESVSIDLSAAGKNVDTAKIPSETVEKIAEKSSMTVKLPVAAVEFDKTATEEIVDQAKGSNIELVVDDVKEVSLNAVQKEAVGKLDTAIIIDAYLESNGSKLCTSDNGGFGGGSAKVILPYEIKNNRKPENYSVFYVNDAGNLEKLNAVYDEELKAFVFEIEHFSVYAVAFEQFVDIDANAYYYDAVKWAAANGVTDGIDDTHFDPNGITNRAQMVTFLWRAAGKPEPTITETPFTDLNPDGYYFKAVLWAYENGITDGTSATTFEPDKNVSRAQTVTFLWRYAGKPVLDYWMQMTDVASGQYYTEAVRWALAESITNGTSKTTFSPNDDCLRGQIVTFLYRSLVK